MYKSIKKCLDTQREKWYWQVKLAMFNIHLSCPNAALKAKRRRSETPSVPRICAQAAQHDHGTSVCVCAYVYVGVSACVRVCVCVCA